MSSEDVVGFLVQELSDDLSAHDILHQPRILYPSWDAAVLASEQMARVCEERCSTRAVCILRATSKPACLENGFVISHRIVDWRTDIYIFPVCAPVAKS